MKKVFLFLTIAFYFAVIVQSCKKKDEQSSPVTIDLSKSATIKGVVRANLDMFNDTSATPMEFAPSGTRLIFQTDAQQFPLNPSGTYDDLIYSTTVGTNGVYSIKVPTANQGVNYTLIAVDFEYDQGQRKLVGGYWVTDGTKRKVYTYPNTPINNVVTDDIIIKDIDYSNN